MGILNYIEVGVDEVYEVAWEEKVGIDRVYKIVSVTDKDGSHCPSNKGECHECSNIQSTKNVHQILS